MFSCADLTESLMATYGTCLGLDAISGVVLAVLRDSRSDATPDSLSLTEQCIGRLDMLLADPLALPV